MRERVSRPWFAAFEAALGLHRRGVEPSRFAVFSLAAMVASEPRLRVRVESGWVVVVCGCCERPVCLACSVEGGRPVTHPWERFHEGASVCSLGRV